MDRQAKSAIKALVLELRHTLEDDIVLQLKRYGYAGGRWIEADKLPHLWTDDAAMAERQRIDAALAQELRRIGVADPAQATAAQREEAVGWFVREIAYTHLNRLAALKALEVRGLIPEVITARDSYGGRSRAHYDLRNAHPELCRGPDEGLAEAIRHSCRQVYREFRLLFDVGDPAEGRAAPVNSLVWPGHTALKACVAAVNGLDERADNTGRSLWLEDEIIGWLYQFYNAEEKEAIRKRGKPRRPAEVAVINQFFTPRWIVKFLVDNTLGRLWLEMHPDSDRVRAKCDYLVPEPLAGEPQKHRGAQDRGFALDPDSPINNPAAKPRRAAKKPQEIRLIDPTCGTMHFGHYSFEVFQEIYAEARERGWVTGHDALPDTEVPAAILRNNLYGVDIDLRAVQLAGLSLFMKARTAEAALHVEETRINQLNLVVADAVLPQDGAREAFLAQYAADKRVQAAVAQVLDEMADIAQVGSLLRVEDRLRQALDEAGYPASGPPGPLPGWRADRQAALPGLEPPTRQLSLADLPGATPEQWGAHYTVARLLEDLRAFAARALRQHDLNAQLFAEEASKSVHLLDVFLNDYDVVVMNPPYGDTTGPATDYLKKAYPLTKNDIYSAFFERALDVLSVHGFVGALTSRTYMNLTKFRKLREEIVLSKTQPEVVLDLGFGVLDDAAVETAAAVLRKCALVGSRHIVFFRLTSEVGDKHGTFVATLNGTKRGEHAPLCFAVIPDQFRLIPESPFTYWASETLRALFAELPALNPGYADVRQGLTTASDERFLRQRWEVSQTSIGRTHRWVPFAKGGDYSKYYYDIDLVVDWASGGRAIKDYVVERYPYLNGNFAWVVKNEEYYFNEGLTWPRVTVKGLNVRHLPAEAIFADKGSAILPQKLGQSLWFGLGFLNSSLAQTFLLMLTPSRSFEIGHLSAIPFQKPSEEAEKNIANLAIRMFSSKASWDAGNEICTRFDAPWLVQAHRGRLLTNEQGPMLTAQVPTLPGESPSLSALLDHVRAVEDAADARLRQLQSEIDKAVCELYEITAEDRALIERELGQRPPELVWPQMERKSDAEKRREHVRRLVSWCLLQALQADVDGILTLEQALDGVRRGLEAEFGEEAAFQMEADLKAVLGQDLAGWLDAAFFKWHTALYKRTPIVWHLASADNRRTLNLFVDYHKLNADTLRKVQTLYLWPARRRQESLRTTAQAGRDPAGVEAAELALEALADFERRLLSVIEAKVACEIPEWAEGPFRGGVYDPVLDDGVRVNLLPLQEAGLLRVRKVV